MAKTNVVMPQMGESIQEGTLTKWHKKVGDKIEREEILFEISTDKVDTEIPSPVSGTVVEILAQEGATVTVNSIVAVIDDAASATASAPSSVQAPAAKTEPSKVQTPPPATPSSSNTQHEHILASPIARKIAEEHSLPLSNIKGTGEANRIVKSDVLGALGQTAAPTNMIVNSEAANKQFTAKAQSQNLFSVGGQMEDVVDGVRVQRVPMTGMRKKIAEHMVMSKRTSPHVTSVIEIDLQKIVDVRQKYKDAFEKTHGFKLSFMPFFMHAAIEAIKAVPVVNASVENDTIIYKKDINLGVAVALDWGLIVPVIKKATDKSFVGVARDLSDLAEKARQKKLSPDDVRGGTFSISNYGGFGTVIGQPIINQPQVAIFGIGAMQKKPVVINDAIAIHTTCYCVLSFDHRIIDGSDSGKFLSKVKDVLENWSLPVV